MKRPPTPTELALDRLTDDTPCYVVRSRWGTTLHRAIARRHYAKGKPPETRLVQDHPQCQVGDPKVGALGKGYNASYIGALKDIPTYLLVGSSGRQTFRMCTKCFDLPRAGRSAS